MSYIEAAVVGSKKIEAILKDSFQAEGRGLHEYLDSVEHRLPAAAVKKARYIASLRNQVVHSDAVIPDVDDFNKSVEDVVLALNAHLEQERIERENRLRKKNSLSDDYAATGAVQTNSSSSSIFTYILVGLIFLLIFLELKLASDKHRLNNEVNRYKKEVNTLNSQLKTEQNKVEELTKKLVVAQKNVEAQLKKQEQYKVDDKKNGFVKPGKHIKINALLDDTAKAYKRGEVTASERSEMDAFVPRLQSWLDIIGVEVQPEIYKEHFADDQLRVVLKLDLKLGSKEFLNAYDGYLRGGIRQVAPKYSRDRRYFRATSKSAAARYVIYAKLTVNGQSRALPMVYSVMSGGTGDCTKDVRPKVVGTGFGYDLCFVEGRYGASGIHAPGYETSRLFNFKITDKMDLSNVDVKIDFDVVEEY